MKMDMCDLIIRKRDGGQLSPEEIRYFVEGFTAGEIPDYQAAALLMTFFFQKLTTEEILALTEAMKCSGDVADLSAVRGIKVDKHSTGGVGDKTTFIVAPLAAACGVPVAKLSGRGLGFTGGTVDKMEAVCGMRTTLTKEEFVDQVNRTGLAVIGQTSRIAPADQKIYALRDVTGTVENLGLIAASIMSKKLASGSDAFVLDVKCGRGAFMETLEEAQELGELMVEIGHAGGKRTIAVITDMNQPLGLAIGNSLEVIEAIETLKGKGPADVTELSLVLAGCMIQAGGMAASEEGGRALAEQALKSGEGLKKLAAMIEAQGGSAAVIDDYSLLPSAAMVREIRAEESGVVGRIDARIIGQACRRAGAGRFTKEDTLDPGAGIVLSVKEGDSCQKGDLLAKVISSEEEKADDAECMAKEAFLLQKEEEARRPLILSMIRKA